MPRTEIVYVCSADRIDQLRISLCSLWLSGTTIDTVAIYLVDGRHEDLGIRNDAVRIRPVNTLSADYFLLNKAYLTQSEADRVVFLDTDTIVLNRLDDIWQHSNADLLGRLASGGPYLDARQAQEWSALSQRIGHAEMTYLNSGFLVFQNRAQRRLDPSWQRATQAQRQNDAKQAAALHSPRHAEQLGLSIAVAKAGLTLNFLDSRQHAYGWADSLSSDRYVFHTGNGRFARQVFEAQRRGLIPQVAHAPFERPQRLRPKSRLSNLIDRLRARTSRWRPV